MYSVTLYHRISCLWLQCSFYQDDIEAIINRNKPRIQAEFGNNNNAANNRNSQSTSGSTIELKVNLKKLMEFVSRKVSMCNVENISCEQDGWSDTYTCLVRDWERTMTSWSVFLTIRCLYSQPMVSLLILHCAISYRFNFSAPGHCSRSVCNLYQLHLCGFH